MLKRNCTGLTLTLFLFTNLTFAQSTLNRYEPNLTAAEDAEARALTDHFNSRLAQTIDVGPLMDEFFAGDFIEQIRKDLLAECREENEGDEPASGVTPRCSVLTNVDPELSRRSVVAMANFMVVLSLTAMNQTTEGKQGADFYDGIPPDAMLLMRQNRHLAEILDDNDEDDNFNSVDEVRDFVNTLETGVAMTQADLRHKPSPLAYGSQWRTLKTGEPDSPPRLVVLAEEAHGLPAGTRVIHVITDIGLTLILAKEGERLKIFWTGLDDD